MVTIDDTIKNIGEYKGDLQAGRRDYERAKQGSERIKQEMAAMEDRLKIYTGFSNMNLPDQPEVTTIRRGDLNFEIKSHAKTKKPQYKTGVVQMETYLDGISCRLHQGNEMPGVEKVGRKAYIEAETLLQAYDIFVAGIMVPEVRHVIRYDADGELADELEKKIDQIDLPEGKSTSTLTADNFANYAKMDHIRENLSDYVKAYEKDLSRGVTAVTTRSSYKKTTSKAKSVDWAYVLTTLVTVPTNPDEQGELNLIADPGISLAEKQRQLPQYDLAYIDSGSYRVVGISIESIYDRIQELKGDQTIEAKRQIVEAREIV